MTRARIDGPVLAKVLPDIFDMVEFPDLGGSGSSVVGWHPELVGGVRARLTEQDDVMG
ncbi:hypothetical protein N9F34_04600 [Alphaproteobacteria bacterium]|nr:hypothetical protein [Alphaproteobacteria bacterium]